MATTDNPTPPSAPDEADWRDLFYLEAFLHLGLSDRHVDRREQVWIKRFLLQRGKPQLLERMEAIVACGQCDLEHFESLARRAKAELSAGEKRQFVHDLAQLVQSKGPLGGPEYDRILELAERIGVPDTEADSILHSVYNVTDGFIAIIGLLALGAILYFTQAVFVPLIIAVFLSMIIHRTRGALTSLVPPLRHARWLATLGAMAAVLGVLFGLVMMAVASGDDIASRFPFYQAKLSSELEGSGILPWLREHGVLDQLQDIPIGSLVSGFLNSLMSLLGNFVLVVIFTGFLVGSGPGYPGLMQEMNEKVGTFLGIKTLICLLTAVVAYTVCTLFGVDFAVFWALVAFLFNFIPSVGSIIATVPPILLAIVQLDSWTTIALFAVLLVLPQTLIGHVLEPKWMGSRLALKPLALLLGLVFWGLLWGIPGMFLATPLMVLLKIVASNFKFSRGFERLISSDPR